MMSTSVALLATIGALTRDWTTRVRDGFFIERGWRAG